MMRNKSIRRNMAEILPIRRKTLFTVVQGVKRKKNGKLLQNALGAVSVLFFLKIRSLSYEH